MPYKPISVGELREQLEGLNDNDKLHFPGQLSFYRLKRVADDEYFIEMNEPQAYLSDDFKKKNPQLKVAFISIENVEGDEEGIVGGPINVELF
ncbi:MAG: hypothetical protein RIR79_1928 [Pseudomonadota bacterium]|jgi:hypothetical protein